MHVDILVNNAGFGTSGEFHTMEFSGQHNQIILNSLTLADITYFVIKDMAERRKGSIINIASTVSFQPVPYMAVYGATKAFVLSFSEALYREYKNYGIKITAVCPGATETNFFDKAGPVGMGKPRKAEQVVKTAVKALKKNKPYAVDGSGNYMVILLSRFLTRKTTVEISGNILKKALYSL
jgi:short-subunit dehydrogenase